jgi:hypothetical protein
MKGDKGNESLDTVRNLIGSDLRIGRRKCHATCLLEIVTTLVQLRQTVAHTVTVSTLSTRNVTQMELVFAAGATIFLCLCLCTVTISSAI